MTPRSADNPIPMKRLIRASSLLILLLCLAGCRPDAAPANPPPTEISIPTTAPTVQRIITPTAAGLSVQSANGDSPVYSNDDLIQALNSYIDESPVVERDSIWTPFRGQPEPLATERLNALQEWEDEWLRFLEDERISTNLQLEAYKIQSTEVRGFTRNHLVVRGVFDLRPTQGEESLWVNDYHPIDEDSWIRDIGLFFTFENAPSGLILVEIHYYHPFEFRYLVRADEGNDEDTIRASMVHWLNGYMSVAVPLDYRLEGYSIDQIQPQGTSNGLTTYFVEFSVTPIEPESDSQWYDGYNFHGAFKGYDWHQIHELERYVGIEHSAEGPSVITLDRFGSNADLVVGGAQAASLTSEEIGVHMMEDYLAGYIGPEVVSCLKLLDFKIDGVTIVQMACWEALLDGDVIFGGVKGRI